MLREALKRTLAALDRRDAGQTELEAALAELFALLQSAAAPEQPAAPKQP